MSIADALSWYAAILSTALFLRELPVWIRGWLANRRLSAEMKAFRQRQAEYVARYATRMHEQ